VTPFVDLTLSLVIFKQFLFKHFIFLSEFERVFSNELEVDKRLINDHYFSVETFHNR